MPVSHTACTCSCRCRPCLRARPPRSCSRSSSCWRPSPSTSARRSTGALPTGLAGAGWQEPEGEQQKGQEPEQGQQPEGRGARVRALDCSAPRSTVSPPSPPPPPPHTPTHPPTHPTPHAEQPQQGDRASGRHPARPAPGHRRHHRPQRRAGRGAGRAVQRARAQALGQDQVGGRQLRCAGRLAPTAAPSTALILAIPPTHPSTPPICSWTASGSGGWFAGLLARHEQLHRWLNTGRPKAYWMSGFFNPQGFLTAGRYRRAGQDAAWSSAAPA